MKIKTWLMLSYFVLMLLPVFFIYSFYEWIQSTYEKEAFEDYLQVESTISSLDRDLQELSLYLNSEKSQVNLDHLFQKDVTITLYNAKGKILFSNGQGSAHSISPPVLFQDLYRLKTGIRDYSIKKPVFINGEIIGVYEISIKRIENIKRLETKRNLIIGLLVLTLVIVYVVMISLVNRKLIRPMKVLMKRMDQFGTGEKVESIPFIKGEVGDLIRHFQRMRALLLKSQEKIQQTQKEKEYMIASITHDLKTPLTSIRAYSESVLYNQLTETEKKEYLQIIVEKADFMKRMFDDLTTYTLLQNTTRKIDKVVVDSEELFEMLLSGYNELSAQKEIHLKVDNVATGELRVNMNQLTRVVDNLVSNALKFTEPGKNIWLGAFTGEPPTWIFPPFLTQWKTNPSGVCLIVQNEGKGIALAEQEKILQPLYQIESARTKNVPGVGLGLSIVLMIIQQHGGFIDVFSKEGYGTAIICYLPFEGKGGVENESI
ncbi:sensor histidine kinase [Pseudoneobacillus sp. C159]